jgi:hypothetical protein
MEKESDECTHCSSNCRAVISNAVILATLSVALAANSSAQNKACDLVTPAELQTVVGTSVSGLKPQAVPGGAADICMGQAGAYRIMLRLAKRQDASGDKEAKGLAIAKQMGAQVEVKKFGDTTCSTFSPPTTMQQAGYNTTCSVFKNGQVGGIEITAAAQKDMVAIDKLKPLADKMAGRL